MAFFGDHIARVPMYHYWVSYCAFLYMTNPLDSFRFERGFIPILNLYPLESLGGIRFPFTTADNVLIFYLCCVLEEVMAADLILLVISRATLGVYFIGIDVPSKVVSIDIVAIATGCFPMYLTSTTGWLSWGV